MSHRPKQEIAKPLVVDEHEPVSERTRAAAPAPAPAGAEPVTVPGLLDPALARTGPGVAFAITDLDYKRLQFGHLKLRRADVDFLAAFFSTRAVLVSK